MSTIVFKGVEYDLESNKTIIPNDDWQYVIGNCLPNLWADCCYIKIKPMCAKLIYWSPSHIQFIEANIDYNTVLTNIANKDWKIVNKNEALEWNIKHE